MKEVALQLGDLNIIIVYVETCINNICWKKGTNSLILRRWRGMMEGGEGWLSISWLFLPTARKFTTGLSLSLSLLYTGRSTPIHLLNSLFSLKNHIHRFRCLDHIYLQNSYCVTHWEVTIHNNLHLLDNVLNRRWCGSNQVTGPSYIA